MPVLHAVQSLQVAASATCILTCGQREREAGVGVLHLPQPRSPLGSFDILKRITDLYVVGLRV